jgi:hypothetical protein
MFGMVRLRHVELHPGTSYTLNELYDPSLYDGLGWEFGFFPMEQIDFPSVVAASSLPVGTWWFEYGRGG